MPIYKIPGEKRDGLQKYRVVVNYTVGGKKRTKEKLVYGKGQAEASEAAIRRKLEIAPPVEREKKRGKLAPGLTVSGLLALYEEERGSEIRKTSLDKKKSILNTHVIPELGEVRLDDLDEERLIAWRTKLAGTDRKAATKNAARRELRALLNYAVERRLIPSNPIRAVKAFRDPYRETDAVRLRYYTKDEFVAYKKAARAAAESDGSLRAWGIYIFFMLAYYTGARKGEINALRWTDVDGKNVRITRSVTQKIRGEAWVETPPKNESSVRRIQMPVPLIEALKEHMERQKRGEGWSESCFICGGLAPIPDTTIENYNQRFAKAAGVKHITIHEFRHSHASVLCNAGINIKEIARRLGHADEQTTMRTYAHLYPQEEERAVGILNGIE